ncbi:MAG: hypothetical protein IJX63_09645 [Lachnospiraceae bacterium]|nr:hypothetical protein [Lachnospiraceae bacterium]
MKKKILIIGLCCMLGLCGCGQVESVESDSAVLEESLQASQSAEKEEAPTPVKETSKAPTASPTTTLLTEFEIDKGTGIESHEEYLDYVTSLSGGYKGVEAQIRVMVKQTDLWLESMDYANDLKKYTITDLDENGRLEIIVVNHGGTGNYTYSRYYEVNESYDGLTECTTSYVEGDSQPDLLWAEEITVYKDAQGTKHYIVQDAIRDVTEYYFIWYDLTLQESEVTWKALATCHESYANATEGAVFSYTTAEGEVITEAEFNSVPEKIFAENAEKDSMVWGWKDMEELQNLSGEALQEVLTETYISKLPLLKTSETSTESIETSSEQRNIEETDSAWHLANWILIENPSWKEHYVAKGLVSDTLPYELKLLKKAKNNITDDEEWLERNELSLQSAAMDKEYTYQVGDYAKLYLYKNGESLADLDFVEYQCANEALDDEGKGWVTQEIRYVLVEDNILYVSSYHYTYAETEPLNAYITAVDLTNYEVLWKTAPLTCNSVNFEIVGDVIFCGYGFTAEEDYLYQLDKKTGEVLSREKVKSQPEYIIYKEDCLYVRTYDTDYVYQLSQ